MHQNSRTSLRNGLLAVAAASALALPLAGCSNDGDDATTTTAKVTTTQKEVGGNVLPPTMLDASTTSATVKVGATVVFNLGDPTPGKFVATSSDPKVVEITSTGGSQGTYTTNSGGKALAKGTAKVTVQLEGNPSDATVATTPETVFTITVD
jgi:hypothetical protein